MLRAAGAAMVFGALAWCGFRRAGWYTRRMRCLEAWQSAVLEGERVLCDRGAATSDFLEAIKQDALLEPFARACIEGLKTERPMHLAWNQALERAAFPLKEEELACLAELGRVLGQYEGEQQRVVLRETGAKLARYGECAWEERNRLAKMWSMLGLSAGVLLVVLFY